MKRLHLLPVLVAAALAIPPPSRAASVVVTVTDKQGRPVEGVHVAVRASPELAEAQPRYSRADWRGVSDLAGIARISGLPVGRLLVDAMSLPDGDSFVRPIHNPRAPPVPLSVRAPTDALTARLELWRGSTVEVQLSANRRAPRMQVRLQPVGGVEPAVLHLSEDAMQARTNLLPGHWTVTPEVPDGWLLADVLVEGESAPGADAVIEVPEGGNAIRVEVILEGMARIGGSLNLSGPSPCPVSRVMLTLIEPGPWIAAARRRGGSTVDLVTATIDRKACSWEAIVPSGTWRVAVECGDACTVEPLAPEIALAAGEDRRLDFSGVVPEVGGGGNAAARIVLVTDADGKPLSGAVIEVRSADAGLPAAKLANAVRTNVAGRARVAIARGSATRIVAGHADHLDAAIDADAAAEPVSGLPDPESPLRIALRRAASIALTATSAAGEPLAGVAVSFRAIDEPDDILSLAEMRRHRRERVGLTDAEGRLTLRGLHGGRVELTARVVGSEANRFLVDVRHGAPGSPPDDADADPARLQLDLVEGVPTEVSVRVRPAARLAVSLDPACADVPREIDVVVVPASRLEDVGDDPGALLDEPALRLARLPRSGPDQLAIEAGPLPGGSWVVALRPDGFARWTFAPGVEVPEEAEPVETVEGSVAAVESVDVDCAPLVVVGVRVASGGPGPDLRRGGVAATWRPADPARGKAVELTPRPLRTRIRLPGVPEGAGHVTVVLAHPHLLPEPELVVERDVNLERAGLAVIEADVPALGGAITVAAATSHVGARRRDSAWRRIVAVADGLATLPSLEPGEWVVADCSTATCDDVARERTAMVEAGKTALLPGP